MSYPDRSAFGRLRLLVEAETRLWNTTDDALRARLDLTMAQCDTLRAIRLCTPPVRVADVAARLSITPGGASKIIDKLVQAGLVERTSDPEDRRAVRLTLTDPGTRRLPEIAEVVEQIVCAVWPDDPAALQVLENLLERLTQG